MSQVALPASNAASIELEVPHPRAYLALGVLVILNALSWLDRQILLLLIDPIKHDMHITDFQVSLLLGLAFAVCYSVASIPLAWIADRYSRRWVMFFGVIGWSLATAASGVASNFGSLFAARFMVGIGEAALAPAAFSLLADLFPRHRLAVATGVLACSSAIGSGFAILAGGLIVHWAEGIGHISLPFIGALQGWQLVFMIVGSIGIPLAFGLFVIPEEGQRRQPRETTRLTASDSAAFLEWTRKNWVFVVGFSLGVSQLGIMAYGSSWAPTFLGRVMHLEIAEVGVKLGLLNLVAGIIGFVGGGFVLDALNRRNVSNAGYRYLMTTSIILAIAGPLAYIASRTELQFFAFLSVVHLVMPYNAVVVAQLNLATPRRFRARLIAIVTTIITLIGMVVGPSSIAAITDYVFKNPASIGWSLGIVFMICGPLGFLSLALTFRAAAAALERARAVAIGEENAS